MLDTLFDKIYVVWGRDPARKEYIQDHFQKCDIENYKFIHSIIPENLSLKDKIRFKFLWDRDATTPPDTFKQAHGSPHPLSLGEVCCSYGHLKAYKTAIDDGCSTFLVIEDDAILNKELVDCALDWKQFIPDDWDILHLHSWRPFDSKREPDLVKKRNQVNDYFYTGYIEYGGTVCYALTVSTARALLSNYYPIRLPSDGVISSLSTNIFARKFYNSYVMNPFLCINTMFESQIDLEQKREGYITRTERYNSGEINFDPNIL